MKLIEVSFKNYKVLEDQSFRFEENPFWWTAPNETGKSTLIEGIRDAFALDPKKLAAKKTENRAVNPVIKVNFSIGDTIYTLLVNAQDESVRLEGSDHTELARVSKIKDFLAEKGYQFFPEVLDKLLILKERDLTVETKRGLKKLLDSLLKSVQIEELKRTLETRILLKGQGFRTQSFGQEASKLREEVSALDKQIEELSARYEEYHKNKLALEETKKKLDALKEKKEAFETAREKSVKFLNFLKYQELQKRLEKLAQGQESLAQALKEKLEEEKAQKLKKERLERQVDNIFEEIKKLQEKRVDLAKKQTELSKIRVSIDLRQKIQELDQKLGPFRNYKPGQLRKCLSAWEVFNGLCKNAQGVLQVVKASEEVQIEDKYTLRTGGRFVFEGQVSFTYRDLQMAVYTSRDIEKEKEKIQKLVDTFGSITHLQKVISWLDKREKLRIRLEYEEDLASLKEREKELEKELEVLKNIEEIVRQKEQERKKLLQEMKNIERHLSEIRKQITALQVKQKTIEQQIATQNAELEEIKLHINAITLGEAEEFQKKSGSIPEIEREIRQIEEHLKKIENEINKLQQEKSYQEGLTKYEPDLNKMDDLLLKKKNLEDKLHRIEHIEKILRFGLVVLSELREKLNKTYIQKFEEYVREIFCTITKGNYIDVRFHVESLLFEEDIFRKRWTVVRKDNVEFDIDRLSDGTSSQLLLSARLALIRLFLQNQKAFLLLDEPFAYFDGERRQRTLEILNSLAQEGWQVIIVSANP